MSGQYRGQVTEMILEDVEANRVSVEKLVGMKSRHEAAGWTDSSHMYISLCEALSVIQTQQVVNETVDTVK